MRLGHQQKKRIRGTSIEIAEEKNEGDVTLEMARGRATDPSVPPFATIIRSPRPCAVAGFAKSETEETAEHHPHSRPHPRPHDGGQWFQAWQR
jgi:hypothetical protein